MKKHFYITFCLIFTFSIKSFSIDNLFNWENLTINKSFDFEEIYGLAAAASGYIYIGTDKGLYYFDGHNISKYNDSLKNSSNDILYFEKYLNKIICVGINNYLTIIDEKNNNQFYELKIFNHSKLLILNSYLDRNFILHFISRVNYKSIVEFKIDILNFKITNTKINSDTFYINYLLSKNIYKYNYILNYKSNFYNSKLILNDSFWVSNEYLYKVKNNTLIEVLNLKNFGIQNSSIIKLIVDKNGNYFFSTNGLIHGLFYFDIKQNKLQKILSDFATGICIDKYDYLWVGILKKGIFRKKVDDVLKNKTYYFNDSSEIKKIVHNNNNIIILSTKPSIYKIDKNEIIKLKNLPITYQSTLVNPTSKNLYYLDDKNIYQIENSVKKLNLNRDKTGIYIDNFVQINNLKILFHKYSIQIFDNNKLTKIEIQPLITDIKYLNDSIILLATSEGIYKFNPLKKAVIKLNLSDFLNNSRIDKIYIHENLVCLCINNQFIISNFYEPYLIKIVKGKVLNVEFLNKEIYLFFDNKILSINTLTNYQNIEYFNYKLNNNKLIGGFIFNKNKYYYNNKIIWCDTVLEQNKTRKNIYLSYLKYNNQSIDHKVNFFRKTNTEFKFDIFNYSNYLVYELNNKNELITKGKLNKNYISFFNLQPDEYTLLIKNSGIIIYTKKFEITPQIYQNIILQLVLVLFLLFIFFKLIKYNINKKNIISYNLLKLESASKLNQLNPHFMFNILGPLQLHLMNTEKGMIFFHNISDLLRKMIYHSRSNEVILTDEINFLKNYLSIQQEINDSIFDYEFNTKELVIDSNTITIPNLLIQPLLENSVQHGVSTNEIKSTINLSFLNDSNYIYICISDDGIDFDGSIQKSKENNSIQIIKERLKLMNPKGSLEYTISNNKLNTKIKIPFKIINNANQMYNC